MEDWFTGRKFLIQGVRDGRKVAQLVAETLAKVGRHSSASDQIDYAHFFAYAN